MAFDSDEKRRTLKFLLTGGAGFIGSNLADLLLADGHDVTVLDDLSSGYRENLNGRAPFILGDISRPGVVYDVSEGVDVIFHLAASVGNTRSINDPIRDAEVNLTGTLRVLEAARAHKIKRVVFSSSAGIFGEPETLPVTECHPVQPDSPYGASKLAAEKACLAYNKLYGMSNVCLRYFNVYGVRQRYDAYGNVIAIFAERMLHGQDIIIFDDGKQTRDFVNVHDIARANYAAALSSDAKGAFNLGSGTRISVNDLAAMMLEISDSKSRILHSDPRPGDVRDSLACIKAASDALGYAPSVDLKNGLVEYMRWMRDNPATLERQEAPGDGNTH